MSDEVGVWAARAGFVLFLSDPALTALPLRASTAVLPAVVGLSMRNGFLRNVRGVLLSPAALIDDESDFFFFFDEDTRGDALLFGRDDDGVRPDRGT
jgi:hypothetical protein